MAKPSAIVVGAGIVGLATARALAVRGYSVRVLDRTLFATGASIRNFGMIWPIGQPAGEQYETALLSRSIWKEICSAAAIWFEQKGSLHLAYDPLEWNVLGELQHEYRHRGYRLLDCAAVEALSPAVNRRGLAGGLYSDQEMVVDPRKALHAIPQWLKEKYGVEFAWGKAVTDISYPAVYCGSEEFEADEIFVCSGSDFETLYPALYAEMPLIKCKLQMMRMAAQPGDWRTGPSLCAGLSLLHYTSFRVAGSLHLLQQKMELEMAEYLKWGIHVMVSQNGAGELTIGDSHEYGPVPAPFDSTHINELILSYLDRFTCIHEKRITQTWNGVYAKHTGGQSHLVQNPEQGVTIINGLGGAGMTLSFGLCERIVAGRGKGD